jgi:hypothetical protein
MTDMLHPPGGHRNRKGCDGSGGFQAAALVMMANPDAIAWESTRRPFPIRTSPARCMPRGRRLETRRYHDRESRHLFDFSPATDAGYNRPAIT